MPNAAVITADIVNSTLLTPRVEKKLTGLLNLALKNYKFEFYRGDSFQVYVKNSAEALYITLQVRAIARSFSSQQDVRAGIGIGSVTLPLRVLRTATGEAFVLSGRGFDALSGEQRLQIQSPRKDANSALRIIGYYADHLFARLTVKQAAVIAELFKEQTQTEVAKKLKKAQATINKHVQAAGWMDIERLLTEYTQVITQFKLT